MIPRETKAPRRKKAVKLVPHGPGGQNLRPAPKPVKYVPHGPGGQDLRPAPKVRVRPRTPQAKAHGRRVVQRSAQHVRQQEKKQVQRKARKYITQNPIKGLQKSEANAVVALSDLYASNPKKYDKLINKRRAPDKIERALNKPDPLDVGVKAIGEGIKSGAKGIGSLGKGHSSQTNFAASTLASSLPGPAGAIGHAIGPKAGKIIENTAREATNIPANIVPATVHIVKPAYKHPGDPKAYVKSAKRLGEATISLPKEYVKAYEKKGVKGVEDTFVKRPLSTALTVAPIPRAPGLLVGKVATRLGKMPRTAARELPGTSMRVAEPTSRSFFKAKRDQKKPVKEVDNKDVQHRVDAEVALQEDLARRAQADTFKKVYKARKKVVGKKQARREASDSASRKQADTRLELQRGFFGRMALVKKDKYVASGAATRHTRDTSKAQFNPGGKTYGRGAIDENGKLHTWYEDEGTHIQRGFGGSKSEDFMINKDGTIHIHAGTGKMNDYEIAAKAIAQDPRLKPPKEWDTSPNAMRPTDGFRDHPNFHEILQREQNQLAKANSPKTRLAAARAKEKSARKALTKLPWVQAQLLRNTGHTIADYTKLEDAETRLFTLLEHHKASAEQERAIGNEDLAKRHEQMAETVNKQLTPIEGELEKLSRVVTNSKGNAGRAQLEVDLKHSDYVNARRERQAIESNPSNMRLVQSGGEPEVFKEATQAINAADKYNAKHSVQMEPKRIKGGWLVVPKSAIKRFEAHEANTETGPISAAFKAYNNLWRKNVLGTHTTWPTGNIGEAALRSAVERVGPMSYIRGYKFGREMKRVDPKAYEAMTGHATKGGHMSMQVHTPDETKMNITGYGHLADFARHVQKMRDKPGIRQVGNAWDGYTQLVMGELSGRAESFFQTGMLGKELARSPLMDGHILKTSKAAIRDAVKGGRETHNQIALGEAVDRMYGQYGKFSPFMRKMISHYTPFIAWTLNSLKWLGIYLPRDHPVLTATAASVQPYVDEWLKDKGLSAFVKGALPSFLQGSIPTKDGGHARFPTRYTPFAIAAGEPEDLAATLLPQLSGVQSALQHQIDWKGQKLRNPDGTPLDPHQLEIYAALTILEGGIPASQQLVGPATHYEKGARTPARLFKPRAGDEIQKSENPFSIVPKKKAKKKKKGSTSLFDSPTESPSKKPKSLFDTP